MSSEVSDVVAKIPDKGVGALAAPICALVYAEHLHAGSRVKGLAESQAMGFSQFFQRFQHAAPGRLAVGDGVSPIGLAEAPGSPRRLSFTSLYIAVSTFFTSVVHMATRLAQRFVESGARTVMVAFSPSVGYFDLGDHSTFGLFCAPEPASTPEQVQILVCGRHTRA